MSSVALIVANLGKQSGPRLGPTKRRTWSGFNLFNMLIIFPKYIFEKATFLKKNLQTTKSMVNSPACRVGSFFLGGLLNELYYVKYGEAYNKAHLCWVRKCLILWKSCLNKYCVYGLCLSIGFSVYVYTWHTPADYRQTNIEDTKQVFC